MIETSVLLTSEVATAESEPTLMTPFDKAVFHVHTVGATTATIKFVAGFGDAPDFGLAASASNNWFYVDTVSVDTGTPVDGSTGYALTGTGVSTAYQLNIDGAKWVGVVVSAWTAGAISASVVKMNHHYM